MLGAGNLNKKWVLGTRWVDTEVDRPRWRLTADYQLVPGTMVGLEYNPAVGEIGFRGNAQVMHETATRPLVALGTSSDRIGTPEGTQQYSITFAKAIRNTKVGPFFSVTYSEFEKGLVFPFGANLQVSDRWSLLGLNDGRKTHALVTYTQESYYITLGYIWLKRPSISVGWGF